MRQAARPPGEGTAARQFLARVSRPIVQFTFRLATFWPQNRRIPIDDEVTTRPTMVLIPRFALRRARNVAPHCCWRKRNLQVRLADISRARPLSRWLGSSDEVSVVNTAAVDSCHD